MVTFARICDITLLLVSLFYLQECKDNIFQSIDKNNYLATESFNVAKDLFNQGRTNYISLKNKSLQTIDTFLDLVYIMNDQMAKELRSSVLKFYKIKYFRDFTNFMITMEEIIDMVEHCLVDPVEKLEQIRAQFHSVIKNFEDVRNFDTVTKCHKELPDEVAAAHCLLHQAVLFNETMQESLVTIVEIKTRQHARDMNSSLYNVKTCIDDFVPKFFDQLLLDAYTNKCGYLRVVNASITDLIKDKWRSNETLFPEKWSPLVNLLKEKTRPQKQQLQDPLFLTLFAANLSSQDILNTLFK
ncbi:uncharacterized protein LOC115456014 isoform X1 [Manduca sexta]|uniref:uncharacterized protein LOC115456014 isoform X1 n=1 Tax=Manduca sexta TaxID=7130 RepID=UPI001183D54F|nr:uncharacterized protein LOC115456014 isoform X1 [Manduca sexta]